MTPTLRDLRETDASAIVKHINDKAVVQNLMDRVPHPYTLQDAHDFIARYDRLKLKIKGFIKAIILNDELVGVISLEVNNDVYRKTAKIGYWLGSVFWRQGIMTEAIKQTVALGFNTYDLNRIEAEVFEGNIGSVRVLTKAGFSQEGIRKQAIIKYDTLIDGHMYAILRNEWLPTELPTP